MITQLWNQPVTIARNNFKYKSLSCWSCNTAVGCAHACRFCYVPQVSTIRMGARLAALGVQNPDAEWGRYVFPRAFDEARFLRTLKAADHTPPEKLNPDGNRAVMFCTTTDPYQVLPDVKLMHAHRETVATCLRLILEHSRLNVRILTRSPLAKQDFELMKLFGPRLLFGMSLPTLDNDLARIYEPHAPAPSRRLETLQAAKAAGLHVYVAMAPTYPDCDGADLRRTLAAVKQLDPVTVFHEPINIRADNVNRIAAHALSLGRTVKTDVFATPESWRSYAFNQLKAVEHYAELIGLGDRIHLWPDASLGTQASLQQFSIACWKRSDQLAWLNHHWNKISAWPK